MLLDSLEGMEGEEEDGGLGSVCDDPRFLKSIREGVCPLCDSPLDRSAEFLAYLAIPCGSPVCDFVLRPHGKLSRISH